MNNSIFYFFYGLAHKSIFIDYIILFFAIYFPFLIIGAGIFYLVEHHSKRETKIVFLSAILSWVVAHALKVLIQFERPLANTPEIRALFELTSFSFPSGHAAFFGALAFAILLSRRRAGYFFILGALIVGAARIAAGVHFPADILGGYAVGMLCVLAVRFVYGRFANNTEIE